MKEAICIRVAEQSLNKDGGRYLLPAVWTNLLRARTAVKVEVPHWLHNVIVEPTRLEKDHRDG